MGTLPLVCWRFQGRPIGIGRLTVGIVLAIMVIPFISSGMREVFLTVPTRLKESAYALGSTKWEVSWDIVLPRSEEHTSELQSLMRISYAVFCLKKKKRCATQRNNTAPRSRNVQSTKYTQLIYLAY